MKFMGDNLTSYAQRLLKENLYMGLEFEEQEELENMLRQGVEVLSENIEKQLGSECKGVKFELYDDTKFGIYSKITKRNGYRGVIKCSRLLIIGTYQMFYCMDSRCIHRRFLIRSCKSQIKCSKTYISNIIFS